MSAKRKYQKITKLWTPLVCFLLATLVLLTANFNRVSYILGGDYYTKQSGVVVEHNTDNLFFIIPMVKIEWSYGGEKHTCEKLDFTSRDKGSEVNIGVNMKAPKYCVLLNNEKLYLFNSIVAGVWLLSVVFLVRHFRLRYIQRKMKGATSNVKEEKAKQ